MQKLLGIEKLKNFSTEMQSLPETEALLFDIYSKIYYLSSTITHNGVEQLLKLILLKSL